MILQRLAPMRRRPLLRRCLLFAGAVLVAAGFFTQATTYAVEDFSKKSSLDRLKAESYRNVFSQCADKHFKPHADQQYNTYTGGARSKSKDVTISDVEIDGGEYFGKNAKNSGVTAGKILGSGDDKGKANCNDRWLLDGMSELYGLKEAKQRREFVCAAGYTRANGSDCVNGNGDFKAPKSTGKDSNMFDAAFDKQGGALNLNDQDYYALNHYTFFELCKASSSEDVTKENRSKGSDEDRIITKVWDGGELKEKLFKLENKKDTEFNVRAGRGNADAWKGKCSDAAQYLADHADQAPQDLREKSLSDVIDEAQTTSDGDTTDSCAVQGVGWFVCPVARFMAGTMDHLYHFMVQGVVVPPLALGNTSDDNLFKVWSQFRNIANIVFVILFLFILYSQITSTGISNYGVKRMLPRLIVAAVLINLSYYICAGMVDISNLVGHGVYQLLHSLPNASNSGSGNNADKMSSWVGIVTGILSGSAAVGGAAVAGAALMANGGLAIAILLPVLIGGVIAAFTAVVILAARMALIYILIAVSPIAMALYLLPNTNKYFDKWRDTLITLLAFYPMFSLLWGMGGVASGIIGSSTETASMDASMKMIMGLFALFVQVAPLIFSYRLLKTANSIAGRLGGNLEAQGSGALGWAKRNRAERLGQAKDNLTAGQDGSGRQSAFVGRVGKFTGLTGMDQRRRRRGRTQQLSQLALTAMDDDYAATHAEEAEKYDAISAYGLRSKLSEQDRSARFFDQLNTNSRAGEALVALAGGTGPENEAKRKRAMAIGKAQSIDERIKLAKQQISDDGVPKLQERLTQAMIDHDQAMTIAALDQLKEAGATAQIGKAYDTAWSYMDEDAQKDFSKDFLRYHPDMKGKDMALFTAATNGTSYEQELKNPEIWSNMAASDLAGQKKGVLAKVASNGGITPERATELLDDPRFVSRVPVEVRVALGATKRLGEGTSATNVAGAPAKTPVSSGSKRNS